MCSSDLETKAHDNSPVSALQNKNLVEIEASGGVALIVHNANINFFEIWVKENA